MTPTAIIKNSFIELGIIEPADSVATADAAFGLEKLNRLLTQWTVLRLFIPYMSGASYAFGTSKQSYTIGPAASTPDFTALRPTRIERANVVLVSSTPNVHIPLQLLSFSEYADLSIPALFADYPKALYYQPTISKGTLWPYPYPTNVSNKIEIFTWNQLAQIATADIGTDYPTPPGYDDAIIYSLAENLAISYGKTVTPELKQAARLARAAIQSINMAPPKLDLSGGGSGGASGGYSRSEFLSGGFL